MYSVSRKSNASVVFTFSGLLFFSGYVLQQRTVKSIHHIIHPEPEPTSVTPEAVYRPDTSVDWTKVAYAQILQRYEDACNAVMVFAELEQRKSPAQRAILYPSAWDRDVKGEQRKDHKRDRSLRLLRKASVRYGVSLQPVNTMSRSVTSSIDPHPLMQLLTLTDFDNVLFLQPSGVVINATILDQLFAHSHNYSISHFVGSSSEADEPLGFMVKPLAVSHLLHAQAFSSQMSPKQVASTCNSVTQNASAFLATSDLRLQSFANSLADPQAPLNGMGYARFSDLEILGPEFYIPQRTWSLARPKSDEPRQIWEGLYGRYREQRMAVCGLDLELLPDAGRKETIL